MITRIKNWFRGTDTEIKNAWHNIVVHPIAGILWLLGLQRAGDWFHGTDTDEANLEEEYPLLDFFSPDELLAAEQRRHGDIAEEFSKAYADEKSFRMKCLFASSANLNRRYNLVMEAVGTLTCNTTGKVINVYKDNFVDGPGNGAEVDVRGDTKVIPTDDACQHSDSDPVDAFCGDCGKKLFKGWEEVIA